MPTINIYYSKVENFKKLDKIKLKIKDYFAEKLSCGAIKLTAKEISIRFVLVKGKGMIGDVELEINAHAFQERIKNQDKICLDAMEYIKNQIPSIGNVKVWLQLSELGHSW